jgi:ankyrin repeat protein
VAVSKSERLQIEFEAQLSYQEIYEAVKANDVKKVLSLIDADPNFLDITDSNQRTPLTVAFAYQRFEIARKLIERGANLFAMNHSLKWGMLYIVERDGLSDTLRHELLEAAIAAGVWEDELFHHVWRRDIQNVESILESDPSRVSVRLADVDGTTGFYNALPYCGLTPLHYAVIACDEAMVRCLLQSGAEVDAIPHGRESDSRYTPMYFVPDGGEGVAEILIEYGADPNHTTLYLSGGSKSMQKVVVANGAGGTPLFAALTVGDFEEASKLIRDNPNVINDRLPDSRVNTPLHLAAKVGAFEIVELLIEHGMDVDTPTSRGFTPLSLAPEMYCSLEMFQLLVEKGADVRAGNDSPLRAAIWQHAYGHENYESVIRFLVEKGSKPRGLHHCARGGNLAFTKLILELGADVNETSDFAFYSKRISFDGNTALDYCTGVVGDQKHPEIAELLIEHGGKHGAEIGRS